ncbi:Uncharacterized protein FWK35_00023438, partial [Aphis craccivora]
MIKNNIFKVDPVSNRKVNLVSTLGGQNVRKNPKKVTEKREFLRKTSFRPNRFFYMVVNQKQITFSISYSDIEILTKIRQKHEYLITCEELCIKFSNFNDYLENA